MPATLPARCGPAAGRLRSATWQPRLGDIAAQHRQHRGAHDRDPSARVAPVRVATFEWTTDSAIQTPNTVTATSAATRWASSRARTTRAGRQRPSAGRPRWPATTGRSRRRPRARGTERTDHEHDAEHDCARPPATRWSGAEDAAPDHHDQAGHQDGGTEQRPATIRSRRRWRRCPGPRRGAVVLRTCSTWISVTPPMRPTASRTARASASPEDQEQCRRHQREEDAERPRQPRRNRRPRRSSRCPRRRGTGATGRAASRRRGQTPGPGRRGSRPRSGRPALPPRRARPEVPAGRRGKAPRYRFGEGAGSDAGGATGTAAGGSGAGAISSATGGSGSWTAGTGAFCVAPGLPSRSSNAVAAAETERLSSPASASPDRRPRPVRCRCPPRAGAPAPRSALSRCAAMGLSIACWRYAGSVQCTLRAIRIRPSTSSCFFGRCCGISATTCSYT